MYYSIALFMGLNFLSFLIILGCYFEIIREVRFSSRRSGNSRSMKRQIRLTTRVAAIVATDFCCWFPIIILSILGQSGVIQVDGIAYAALTTFVLPINSTINPFLYTIAFQLSKRPKQKQEPRKTNNVRNQPKRNELEVKNVIPNVQGDAQQGIHQKTQNFTNKTPMKTDVRQGRILSPEQEVEKRPRGSVSSDQNTEERPRRTHSPEQKTNEREGMNLINEQNTEEREVESLKPEEKIGEGQGGNLSSEEKPEERVVGSTRSEHEVEVKQAGNPVPEQKTDERECVNLSPEQKTEKREGMSLRSKQKTAKKRGGNLIHEQKTVERQGQSPSSEEKNIEELGGNLVENPENEETRL